MKSMIIEHRAILGSCAALLLACRVMFAAAPARAAEGDKQEKANRGIEISVLDAKDKTPIGRFRVLAGVPAGSVTSEEFKRRTGRDAVNWQPHTVRVGKDGSYVWPTEPGYQEMTLRVEADGYLPQMSGSIKRFGAPARLEFLLVEDAGIAGIVLEPRGVPAVAATVAVALAQRDAVIENGRIRGEADPPAERESDRWRRPTMVKTGLDGRFLLPTETDPAAAVLIVHESGVREMPIDEFQRQPHQTLLPRGSSRWPDTVEGQAWSRRDGDAERVPRRVRLPRNDRLKRPDQNRRRRTIRVRQGPAGSRADFAADRGGAGGRGENSKRGF